MLSNRGDVLYLAMEGCRMQDTKRYTKRLEFFDGHDRSSEQVKRARQSSPPDSLIQDLFDAVTGNGEQTSVCVSSSFARSAAFFVTYGMTGFQEGDEKGDATGVTQRLFAVCELQVGHVEVRDTRIGRCVGVQYLWLSATGLCGDDGLEFGAQCEHVLRLIADGKDQTENVFGTQSAHEFTVSAS